MSDPEEFAWQAFAELHPHEAYETWPDRFWKFFQEKRPGVSRQRMEEVLRETEPTARYEQWANPSVGTIDLPPGWEPRDRLMKAEILETPLDSANTHDLEKQTIE